MFTRGVSKEVITVTKAADENVTNSSTLQNDDHLLALVAAFQKYLVTVYLLGLSNAARAIKFGFYAPAGATLSWSYGEALTLASTQLFSLSAVLQFTSVTGILTMSTTAGIFGVRWAQNAADATIQTIKSGSVIRVEKIG
jgi:hypothetical protein